MLAVMLIMNQKKATSFEHHACFAHVLQQDGMAKAGQINGII